MTAEVRFNVTDHGVGGEHYRAMIFQDFKVDLCEEQCVQRLYLAFGDEPHSLFLGSLQNFAEDPVLCVMKNILEGLLQQ